MDFQEGKIGSKSSSIKIYHILQKQVLEKQKWPLMGIHQRPKKWWAILDSN